MNKKIILTILTAALLCSATIGVYADEPESTSVIEEISIAAEEASVPTEEVASESVAYIAAEDGSVAYYDTLNAAIDAAQGSGGAEIVLITDCDLDVNKAIEITTNVIISGTGSETISMKSETQPSDHYIEIKTGDISTGLTFKDCSVEATNLPESTNAYNAYIRSNGGMITLDNATMTLDGSTTDGTRSNCHGIWTLENGDNAINVINGSTLTINNFKHNSIEWDGTSRNELNILGGSAYNTDSTRSAITGTWFVTMDNSTSTWTNCLGNGSNGSNFYLTDSILTIDNCGAHGLSATELVVDNSTITSTNNGYYGIVATTNEVTDSTIISENNGWNGYVARETLDVENSDIVIDNNGYYKENDTYAGLQLGTAKQTCTATVDEDSSLIVTNNAGNGIRLKNTDTVTLAARDITVTNNHSSAIGDNGTGGGINVQKGNLILAATAKVYNNHADIAGDDIYVANEASITFGNVGNNWILNDCGDIINGWYDDSEESRWEAHSDKDNYIVSVASGVYSDGLAIKAAHDEIKPFSIPEVAPDTGDNSIDYLHICILTLASVLLIAWLIRIHHSGFTSLSLVFIYALISVIVSTIMQLM